MIRYATDDDLSEIVSLAREFFSLTPYASFLPFDEDKTKDLAVQIMELPRHKGLVLVLDNGGVQGLFVATVNEAFCTSTPIANELIWYVRPEYRGKEALQLHEAFSEWTRRLGLAAQTVSSISGGSDMDKYYTRQSYTVTETSRLKVL